jgi:hypothetical protein
LMCSSFSQCFLSSLFSLDAFLLAINPFNIYNGLELWWANNRWLIEGAESTTLIIVMASVFERAFSKHDKPSAARRNKYGDIGSPWRIPHRGLKLSTVSPLKRTEKEAYDTHLIIVSLKR